MNNTRKFLNKWHKRLRMFIRLLMFKLGSDTRPVFAVLTVTASCNFRCKYCFSDYHLKREEPLSTEKIISIIDELAESGVIYLTVHGGEALLRNDIGMILRHASGKKMFVNLITNGSLLQDRWEDVGCVDTLCISLDGREENNDRNRGTGAFRAASEAVEFALMRGAVVRLGMTITKHTQDDLQWVAGWAKERGIYVHHFLLFDQESLPEELRMTREENRIALRELVRLKKTGYPVFYSLQTLEYALNWPYDGPTLNKTDAEALRRKRTFELMPCNYKTINILVESNGTLRVCNALARKATHISIIDKPIMEAKRELLANDDCLYCYHLPKMEMTNLMSLQPGAVLNQLVNQVREDIKAFISSKRPDENRPE